MSQYDPNVHDRRSIRLKGYDYAQPGAYFVTICTREHVPLFGEIAEGEMRLNRYGQIVKACWRDLPGHYAHVSLDAFVVMPNHVHGIIVLTDEDEGIVVGAGVDVGAAVGAGLGADADAGAGMGVGAGLRPAPTATPASAESEHANPRHARRHGLPEIVRAFKSFSARRINAVRDAQSSRVWQRNYYDHVIRNDRELWAIQEYIANNPAQWAVDRENPCRNEAGPGSNEGRHP